MNGGNIYLVGMMGAGKTTVGKRLARQLERPFIDLDKVIEQATGVSVSTIFEIEGEAGFRLREMQSLGDAARQGGLVVATGGGAVLSPQNRACMQASGYVVYLHARPEMLYERTRHDKGRPLLQVANPLARITELVQKRDPLYREIAHLIVECHVGLGAIVNRIRQEVSSCHP